MTKIIYEGDGILNLGAISKEEDLNPKCRVIINGPPRDGICEVCRRHLSELKPFGGPGDPLEADFTGEEADFTGELLVKTWRHGGPYDEEAEKTMEEAEKETQGSNDPLPWLITKYGKEKAEEILSSVQLYGAIASSWECRDCIVLDDDEYFERLRESYHERQNRY
jgi:hypothetical protein